MNNNETSDSTVTMDELAGVLAQRALDIDYSIDDLKPGTDEWLNAIKGQSTVHQDLLAYERNSIEASEKKTKIRWAKIGAILTAVSGVVAAVIKWVFWDHVVTVQKQEIVPKNAEPASNDVSRGIADSMREFRNNFR